MTIDTVTRRPSTGDLTDFFNDFATHYVPYHEGAWCYEDGCLYRGLELLHRVTGEYRWLAHLERLISAQVGSGPSLKGYDVSAYNIDNILSGRALLYLHQLTGESRWLDVVALLDDQLQTQPRTRSGVYWHKLRYPWQVWLDGLYMGPPFQIGYGQVTDRPALVQDAVQQVGTALDMARVNDTGLYAHAVDEARKQHWAHPGTGQSSAHWSRSLGWLAMSLVDMATLLSENEFEPLRAATCELLSRIAELRQPDGLWLQVIDRPDLQDNYEESSASAMFTYALLRGRSLGLHGLSVDGLYDCLIRNVVRAQPDGRQVMTEICKVAGLGLFQNRYRDGSAEYYLTEPRVSNDAKGVGPLMMCLAAAMASGEDVFGTVRHDSVR